MTRHSKGHLIDKRRACLTANLELAAQAYPAGQAIAHGWKLPPGVALVELLRAVVPYSPKTSTQDIYWTNAFHYRDLLKASPELARRARETGAADPWMERALAAERALAELVAVKDRKDIYGLYEQYEAQNILAWRDARVHLHKHGYQPQTNLNAQP